MVVHARDRGVVRAGINGAVVAEGVIMKFQIQERIGV
jgi:hypothetical protein